MTPGGGSVTGSGSITFSGGKTLLNLSFNANQALLLNRDDVAARVTGPLQIRSDGNGGTISGDLQLNKGRFQLGRASAAAAVPQLNVRESGLDPEDVIEVADLHPWKLDLKLAGSELQVVGLGINSQWTTNLQVGGLADAPRFTGRADLVRGDYDFAGRNFKLDHGTIRFQGENPPNPLLDIHASAQVQGLDASVIVRDRAQAGDHLRELAAAAAGRAAVAHPVRHLDHQPVRARSASARLGGRRAPVRSGSLDPINALRRAVASIVCASSRRMSPPGRRPRSPRANTSPANCSSKW